MILRPLQSSPSSSKEFVPAWPAVERSQTQNYEACWLITQPSHAVLAADLAAIISAPQFPAANPEILQAIALHDAGWGIPDAQAIMKSRSVRPLQPESFIAMAVPQFLEAWEKSIETCQSISPAGGYIVSRHFWRLAEQRVKSNSKSSKQDAQKLESFLQSEERRQKKLAGRQPLSIEQLESLTDLLQFCDLFSLHVCCGAAENVVFSEYFNVQVRVTRRDDTYSLDPKIMKSGSEFALAMLRYPATKEESSREIKVRIG
jgi:hypothetical protein